MTRDEDVISREPLNAETSWDALATRVTPTDGFYTRNNYPIPQLARDAWRLRLAGFERAAELSFADLARLRAETLEVVLECAGNGRTFFEPRVEGTAWRERAVGCATFTGARLGDVLREAGVPRGTVEVVFRGADGPFERSLPLDVATAPDTLLAWEMNGEPLRPRHGAPVRLLVPGWYGVASVKWLVEMRATATPFRGHYQTERYVYETRKGAPDARPVREKRVNSLIWAPAPGASIRPGTPLVVTGWAWSGHGPIRRVEVSADGGRSWSDAKLDAPPSGPHAWRGWSWETRAPPAGELTLLARATDAAGNAQPERAEWNVHGYGYNAPRPRTVHVG